MNRNMLEQFPPEKRLFACRISELHVNTRPALLHRTGAAFLTNAIRHLLTSLGVTSASLMASIFAAIPAPD